MTPDDPCWPLLTSAFTHPPSQGIVKHLCTTVSWSGQLSWQSEERADQIGSREPETGGNDVQSQSLKVKDLPVSDLFHTVAIFVRFPVHTSVVVVLILSAWKVTGLCSLGLVTWIWMVAMKGNCSVIKVHRLLYAAAIFVRFPDNGYSSNSRYIKGTRLFYRAASLWSCAFEWK